MSKINKGVVKAGVFTSEYEVKLIRDGKVIHVEKGQCHSLVRNALRFLYAVLTSGTASLKSIAGAAQAITCSGVSAINGFNWKYGVGCGSSATAYNIDQYELSMKIAQIASLSIEVYTEEDGTGYWQVTGGINMIGVDTVREICLYGSNNAQQFMAARDVLGAPFAVVAGDTVAVTYKLQTSNT